LSRATRAAQGLLLETRQAEPPVDVEAIAEHLGVQVVSADLSDDVSGMLIREDGVHTVGINHAHSETRKRFTLAHEIGHLQLHKGRPLIIDSPVRVNLRDRTSGMATDREEVEANQFAAELLMPEDMIFTAVAGLRNVKVENTAAHLAKKFGVSPEAMGYRLINLGILS
jgi:Zn-dependent peptidase ImmA (M78 family)